MVEFTPVEVVYFAEKYGAKVEDGDTYTVRVPIEFMPDFDSESHHGEVVLYIYDADFSAEFVKFF